MTVRSIFISGGASGIGRAVAQHFAVRGWRVGLGDVNEPGMAETLALLPDGALVVNGPIDADTTPRAFQRELRWSAAYHRLAEGL